MIRLYHYSQADFKDKIKVKFYGLNYYTTNDKNLTDIKRAFYYTKPEPEALYQIKKRYNGVIYNIGKNEVVNLFYDVKFTKKEVLK